MEIWNVVYMKCLQFTTYKSNKNPINKITSNHIYPQKNDIFLYNRFTVKLPGDALHQTKQNLWFGISSPVNVALCLTRDESKCP